jgi:hypothetical protein
LSKVDKIEDIEKLAAELEFGSLRNPEEFHNAEIHVLLPGATEEVSG